jgi:LysR family transcriptional regulator, regulator for metE and metH
MEIRHLRAFVALAETGTPAAGASALGITRAAVSAQIRQLEEEVGAQLFARGPERLLLTEAGQRMLVRARNILREHDAVLREMAEMAGTTRERLRLGSASANISSEALPPVLAALRERHTEVEIFVKTGTSESLVQQILTGELDVALVSLPVEVSGIKTETLVRDSLVAIVSPEHRLAKERVVSAYTLAGENLILGERGGNTRRMIEQFFAGAGVRPIVSMELNRLAAIKRMVEANMGVGIVPSQSVSEEVEDGRLVALWIEGAQINWELGLARLSAHYHPPVCQSFAHICREHFGQPIEPASLSRKPLRRVKGRRKRRAS